jgi:hypothetical protein
VIDGIGPCLDWSQRGIAVFDLGIEGCIPQLRFARNPFIQRPGVGHLDAPGIDLRPLAQQVERPREGGKPVHAAGLRIEIHEVPAFAGVFADRLQPEILDVHRCEALLVLDLHRVEHAAIGVNADEEFPGRFEINEKLFRLHFVICD